MIAIITHKENMSFEKEGYAWLHVGTHDECKIGYIYDDTGDNISNLNKWYAELTGIYWLWKNNSDDIKGIVHYRRFFTQNFLSGSKLFYLDYSTIRKHLVKYDLIIPRKYYLFGGNNYKNYSIYHKEEDIKMLRNIIEKEMPEYLKSFDTVMTRSYLYPFNMFISSAEVFDNYCEWLFGMISKCDRYYDLSRYNDVQSRIYGFLGERLFNVWLEESGYSYIEKCVVQTDSSFKERIKRYFENKLKRNICRDKIIMAEDYEK